MKMVRLISIILQLLPSKFSPEFTRQIILRVSFHRELVYRFQTLSEQLNHARGSKMHKIVTIIRALAFWLMFIANYFITHTYLQARQDPFLCGKIRCLKNFNFSDQNCSLKR
jgi:hypothetical protein